MQGVSRTLPIAAFGELSEEQGLSTMSWVVSELLFWSLSL